MDPSSTITISKSFDPCKFFTQESYGLNEMNMFALGSYVKPVPANCLLNELLNDVCFQTCPSPSRGTKSFTYAKNLYDFS